MKGADAMKKLLCTVLALILVCTTICAMAVPSKAADFSDKYELYEAWDSELKSYTQEISEEYEIPYAALIAIIYHESRFDSSVGSSYIGLMQVGCTTDIMNFLSERGLSISKSDLYNAKVNIKAGALILRYAMDKTDTMEDAFYIYTCGEGAVKIRKQKGLAKNKATVEITELYYEYANYFAESKRQAYKEFLLDELNSAQTELNDLSESADSCEAYQTEYYDWQIRFSEMKLEYIQSELEGLE